MVKNKTYNHKKRVTYYQNLDKYLNYNKNVSKVNIDNNPDCIIRSNVINLKPNQGIDLLKAMLSLENKFSSKNDCKLIEYKDPSKVTVIKDKSNLEDDLDLEYEIIHQKIDSIKDLIILGKNYEKIFKPKNKRFNLNLKILSKLVKPLEELNEMIGMENVKEAIFNKLILYLQNLGSNDYHHVVISGQPGMGKTHVAKIIGKIYTGLGILSKGKFTEIKITDLKAGYVGQSELKTQKLLEESLGNVLFLDEAYSFGSHSDNIDSFSQNIIDIINPFIEKHKNDLVLIVAGYKDDLDNRFFKGNQGLKSRFGLFLDIKPYSHIDLSKMFTLKIQMNEWFLDNDVDAFFFKKYYQYFKFFGRDIENFISKCKIAHAKRVLFENPEKKKIINQEDINSAIQIYMNESQKKINKNPESFFSMYC